MMQGNETVPSLTGLVLYKYLIKIIQKRSVSIWKMKTTLKNVNQPPFQGSNIHWQLLKRKLKTEVWNYSLV